MSLYRLLLLHRSSSSSAISSFAPPLTRALHYFTSHPLTAGSLIPTPQLSIPSSRRTFAFSSAEEAAAERRRRKRRLRIEPPMHALQRDPHPPVRDPNAPRLPDSTSALVGPRLSLHNRVQSLIRAFDLDAASYLARTAVFSRIRPTVFTCNAIIAAMYRAKRYSDAIALFKYFFEQNDIVPNVVSYNNVINAHCDEGRVDTGLEVYKHIIANAPFSPSPVTYRHLTKGLIDAGRIEEAVDLLREMLTRGHGADSLVYNNLIKGFLELGNLDKANEFFDELKGRCLVYDGVVNATVMDWWFKQGKDKEAMESYRSLMARKFRMVPATCNVLLELLLRYGKKEAAMELFEEMLDNHTPPTFQAVNSETFSLMVNECFKEGKFHEAIETFRKVGTQAKSRPFGMDVAGYNNIIIRFSEKEMMTEAEEFFTEMTSKCLSPDVTTFKTLIEAYLKLERIDDALNIFDQMVNAGLWVVASFGTRIFGELIKNGKAVECAQIMIKMGMMMAEKMGDRDVKPDSTIYDVVVRGLCDAGELDCSRDVIDQMMSYGVGIHPCLKEFARKAFGDAGRGEEIEKLLDENQYRNTPRPPFMGRQPGTEQFPGSSVNALFGQARHQSPSAYNRAGQSASSSFQRTGQQSSQRWGQAPSESSHPPLAASPTGGQGLVSQNKEGQQPSGPIKMTSHQPLLSSQLERQQSSWSAPVQEQKPSWPSPNHQQSGQSPNTQQSSSSPTQGQQPLWSSSNHQQSGSSPTQGQQSSWSSPTQGQQPLWSSSNHQQSGSSPTQGQQSSWSSPTQGQQPSWSSPTQPWSPSMHGQNSSPLQGQQASWSSLAAGLDSSQSSHAGGQSYWSARVAGQQQSSWSSPIGAQQSSVTQHMNTTYENASSQSSYGSSQSAEKSSEYTSSEAHYAPAQSAGQHSSTVSHVASNHHPVEGWQKRWPDDVHQFDPMARQQHSRVPETGWGHPQSPQWQDIQAGRQGNQQQFDTMGGQQHQQQQSEGPSQSSQWQQYSQRAAA
ncbi:Pentatricopeptide repeat-containing protein At1g10270 [Linum grandiflorum]